MQRICFDESLCNSAYIGRGFCRRVRNNHFDHRFDGVAAQCHDFACAVQIKCAVARNVANFETISKTIQWPDHLNEYIWCENANISVKDIKVSVEEIQNALRSNRLPDCL